MKLIKFFILTFVIILVSCGENTSDTQKQDTTNSKLEILSAFEATYSPFIDEIDGVGTYISFNEDDHNSWYEYNIYRDIGSYTEYSIKIKDFEIKEILNAYEKLDDELKSSIESNSYFSTGSYLTNNKVKLLYIYRNKKVKWHLLQGDMSNKSNQLDIDKFITIFKSLEDRFNEIGLN